jgi:hypothetical protein
MVFNTATPENTINRKEMETQKIKKESMDASLGNSCIVVLPDEGLRHNELSADHTHTYSTVKILDLNANHIPTTTFIFLVPATLWWTQF